MAKQDEDSCIVAKTLKNFCEKSLGCLYVCSVHQNDSDSYLATQENA